MHRIALLVILGALFLLLVFAHEDAGRAEDPVESEIQTSSGSEVEVGVHGTPISGNRISAPSSDLASLDHGGHEHLSASSEEHEGEGEGEVELHATPLEGGTLDDALDRGESIGPNDDFQEDSEHPEVHEPASTSASANAKLPVPKQGSGAGTGSSDSNSRVLPSAQEQQRAPVHAKEISEKRGDREGSSGGGGAFLSVDDQIDAILQMDASMGRFCSTNQKIGVSLVDSLDYLSPGTAGFSDFVDVIASKIDVHTSTLGASALKEKIQQSLKEHLPTTRAVKSAAHAEIPLDSLLSDGLFEISDIVNPRGIFLVQRNYVTVNHLCKSEFSRSAYFPKFIRDAICTCGEASPVTGAHSSDESEWCKSPVVCEAGAGAGAGNTCRVKVDPFRTACIVYDTKPARALGKVSYTRTTPMLDVNLNLTAVFGEAGQLMETTAPFLKTYSVKSGMLKTGSIINKLVHFIPAYLSRMVAGMWLLYVADDLASNTLFQFLVTTTFGLLLAVLWIVLVIYRTTETLFKAYLPMFAPFLGLVSLAPMWWVMKSPEIRSILMERILDFWHTGIAGYPNAGKAYFLVTILLSILVKTYFGLFKHIRSEDGTKKVSNSLYVLKMFIRCLGCALLCYCTSNRELSLLFLLYGLSQDRVLHIWYRLRFAHEVYQQKSPQQLMGRELYTQAELKDVVASTTQRELKKLEMYLKSNPSETSNLQDKLMRGDKHKTATLLGRFAQGMSHLASTPLANEEDDDDDDDEEMWDFDTETWVPKKKEKSSVGRGRTALYVLIGGFIVLGLVSFYLQRAQIINYEDFTGPINFNVDLAEWWAANGPFNDGTPQGAAAPRMRLNRRGR